MDTTKLDNNKYIRVHSWLIRTYGKANKCESLECEKSSKHFEWAQIHDMPLEKDRSNFMNLCRKCHVKYDNISKKCWASRR